MNQVQVKLDYLEISKIVNGLLVLRQKQVELQIIIFIDETNLVNRQIIREVTRIDSLISRLQDILDSLDDDRSNTPEENDN